MHFSIYKRAVVACAVVFTWPAGAQEATDPLVIKDEINQKLKLDCTGRPVVINARLSEITLNGNCGPIEINGPQNTVMIGATPVITVTNFGNTVRWINKLNDKAPRIKDEGTFNSIKQFKPDPAQ